MWSWAEQDAGRVPAAAGARPQPRRADTVRSAAFVGLLGVIVVVLLVLPQALRLTQVPRPIWLTSLSGQVSGTYVTATGGLYKLYPYPELRFPVAPATVPGDTHVLVRARQLVQRDQYGLYTYPAGRPVITQLRLLDRSTIALVPATALAPGRYYVQAPADDVNGGAEYFGFVVAAAAKSAAATTAEP